VSDLALAHRRPTKALGELRSWIGLPLVTAAAMTFVFHRYSTSARNIEANVIGAIGSRLNHGVGPVDQSRVLVTRGDDRFWANVTPSCSSLLLICVLTVFIAIATRRAPLRRIAVLFLVNGFVAAANSVRLTATVLVAARFGRTPMTWVHDWVGTAFTFVSCGVAMAALLSASRPRMTHRANNATHPLDGSD
jgi:exosortase/archaeosortase family protein